jgi:hypothetical protein
LPVGIDAITPRRHRAESVSIGLRWRQSFSEKILKPNNRAGCFFGKEKLGALKLYNSSLLPTDPLQEPLCEHQEKWRS